MQNYQMLHSEACERNKAPILECLKSTLSEKEVHFLELGFGTGQHAYAFSEAFPEKTFTIADRESYHGPFMARVEALGKRENIQGPYSFEAFSNDVKTNLPHQKFDAIYCANVFHIMSWDEAKATLKKMKELLSQEGVLLFYGPFKFEGQFTSPSNHQFDLHLKAQNPQMGIRNFEEIVDILAIDGIQFLERNDLPANNHLLIFRNSKKTI